MRNLDGGTEEGAETANAPELPAPDVPEETDAAPDPEDAAEDTFVALLPGEEPLIIDTDMESSDTAESPEDFDTPDPKPTN